MFGCRWKLRRLCGLVPWFRGDAPKQEHKESILCLTSVDLVRERTQTQVAGRREAGMGHKVPYGFMIPQQYM